MRCELADRLAAVPGVEVLNDTFFNEFTIRVPGDAARGDRGAGRRRASSAACRSRGSMPDDPDARRPASSSPSTEINTDEDRAAYAAALTGGAVMLNAPGTPDQRRRPTMRARRAQTFTGNRGAADRGAADLRDRPAATTTGVDLPEPPKRSKARLGGFEREGADRPARPHRAGGDAPLRAAVSQKNYAIDTGLYPLGSCTMKHNPRLNEKMARLPGFGDIHPLQPLSTVPGALELIAELGRWLLTLTGMPAVAMSPEGRRAWRALRHDGDQGGARRRAATSAIDGAGAGIGAWHQPGDGGAARLPVVDVPARADGTVDVEAVKARSVADVAAIMLTNPNTCGLFERDVVEIAEAVHDGRRLFLLRRRQLQRHRRQGAAGRSRRRRHAHQPAQDLLDAAWRRRAGRRAGGAVGGARALRAGALRRGRRRRRRAGRDARPRQATARSPSAA